MLKKQLKNIAPLLLTALLALLIDQTAKFIIHNSLRRGQSRSIIPGVFNISYSYNTGAAFGILKGWNWMFVVIIFIAIGFIFMYYRYFMHNLWMKISLGFLLGGALGNLIDRIRFQYVIDFIDFRWWPTFNTADISVSIGAAMLLAYIFRRRGDYEKLTQKEMENGKRRTEGGE